jgi:hypothetical protein
VPLREPWGPRLALAGGVPGAEGGEGVRDDQLAGDEAVDRGRAAAGCREAIAWVMAERIEFLLENV